MEILQSKSNIVVIRADLQQLHYSSFVRRSADNAQLAVGINHAVCGFSTGIKKDDTGLHNAGKHVDLRPCLCVGPTHLVSTIKPTNHYWSIDNHKYIWQAGPSLIEFGQFDIKYEEQFEYSDLTGNHCVIGNTATGKLLVAVGTDCTIQDVCTELNNHKCRYAMLCNKNVYLRLDLPDLKLSIGKSGYGIQVRCLDS